MTTTTTPSQIVSSSTSSWSDTDANNYHSIPPQLHTTINGLDISQSDKSISIVDQEAFYDEILCTEQVNRDDQEAFYDEIMYIEQVPFKDNEHRKHGEHFAIKLEIEKQQEKWVNDNIHNAHQSTGLKGLLQSLKLKRCTNRGSKQQTTKRRRKREVSVSCDGPQTSVARMA